MRRSIFFLIMISCLSCSSENRYLEELRMLCEGDAGFRIHKTVQARGYFDSSSDSGVIKNLIEKDYGFIEYCDESPSRFNAIPNPGCFRLEKVARDLGKCSEAIDSALANVIVEPYPKFLESNCVSVEALNEPSARYIYKSNYDVWNAQNRKSQFARSYVWVEDRITEEILGSYIYYTYTKSPGLSGPIGCNYFGKDYQTFSEINFIESVIIPNK